jgi:urea transport system ATP-binding protein
MNNLLEVKNISVSFDGFKAVNNLSFRIGYNEIKAVIGPNGAGKTTFMDIITGQTKPDNGDVLWTDKQYSLLLLKESEIAQLGVGRKFQKPTIFENKTVLQNLIISQKKIRNPFSVIFQSFNNLFEIKSKISGELSHGQKQWLEIGMLLTQEPKLLLVDEPAAGMTTEERQQTVKILKKLSLKKSIIVVEHDMEFIKDLECNVTVLHDGSILSEGTINEVSNDENVIEVYLGR